MKTTIALSTAALMALAAPAFANAHTQGLESSANARSMADALQGGGGGNNSSLKDTLSLEGNGGVASFVSGGGTGGWGNEGSKLTGGQVSKRNKNDD